MCKHEILSHVISEAPIFVCEIHTAMFGHSSDFLKMGISVMCETCGQIWSLPFLHDSVITQEGENK
jgi:hypothetical protein